MNATLEISRAQLKRIAVEGDSVGFNRQIAEAVIENLQPNHPIKVSPILVHEHIGGKKVAPHIRTGVSFTLCDGTEGFAVVDVHSETFNALSSPALRADEAEAEKTRAQAVVSIGEIVEMDLLFAGALCGNDIRLPRACNVEFLKDGFSPFRIIAGLIDESLTTWDDGHNRYVIPSYDDESDDEEEDRLAVTRFEYLGV